MKNDWTSANIRTHRPALPTVAEVLALPVMVDGEAAAVAGSAGLQAPVRWVHVVESRDVGGLLDGGELLLATGVGWPAGTGWMAGYLAELAAAGVAGLVLELGTRYQDVPEELAERCEAHGLPLLVLRRKIKFVSVTEAVHGRIIAEQMAALQARDDVHALFTGLSLRGSPADYIVAQLGSVLGCPVVLEDMAHQVVAFEAAGMAEERLLGDWETRSRAAHRARADGTGSTGGKGTTGGTGGSGRDMRTDSRTSVLGAEGWLVTPVEARGTRWGYLIAFDGAPHPAGRTLVLEQAAVALSLSRLADGTAENWIPASQHWLLASLLQGRYRSETALHSRFEAMGLPITQRRLCGVALRLPEGTTGPGGTLPSVSGVEARRWPSPAEIAWLARSMGANAVAGVMTGSGTMASSGVMTGSGIMASAGTGGGSVEAVMLLAVSVPAPAENPGSSGRAGRASQAQAGQAQPGPGRGVHLRATPDAAVDNFAARLQELFMAATAHGAPVAMAAGAVVDQVGALAASLQEAAEVLGTMQEAKHGGGNGAGLRRADGHGLRRLIGQLRSDPRLQSYQERSLGALLEHDARHGSDLVDVLRAYLAHPGNRTLAAANSHLSRSVFYQRLELIGDLLDVDLAAGEVIAGLHTALLTWETTRSQRR